MLKTILVWLSLVTPLFALNQYKIETYRVIDGDTLNALIYLDFDIYVNNSIRLFNLEAPERNTAAGKSVLKYVELWAGKQTVLWTINLGRDKYAGRFVGKVYGDTEELNKLLIDNELVKIYDINKPKPKWSAEELEHVRLLALELTEKLRKEEK